MPHAEKMRLMIPVVAPGITWMAIVGNCQLALRHPLNNGASRNLVEAFVSQIGEKLIGEGVITPEEWAVAVAGESLKRGTA